MPENQVLFEIFELVIDRLIERARIALMFVSPREIMATMAAEGIEPSTAYLAVKAAIIANKGQPII